jgi:hypothetical protein
VCPKNSAGVVKAFEDQDKGQRINAFDAVKVQTESEVEGCDVDKVKTESEDNLKSSTPTDISQLY